MSNKRHKAKRAGWRRPSAEVAEIVRLRLNGETLAQIGERFDLSRERVRRILQDAMAELPTCRKCGVRPCRSGTECAYCASRKLCRNASMDSALRKAQRLYPDDLAGQAKELMPGSRLAVRVVRLWLQGQTISDIARRVGSSQGYVGQLIWRLRGKGVELPMRTSRSMPE